jgi:hypothetical protein
MCSMCYVSPGMDWPWPLALALTRSTLHTWRLLLISALIKHTPRPRWTVAGGGHHGELSARSALTYLLLQDGKGLRLNLSKADLTKAIKQRAVSPAATWRSGRFVACWLPHPVDWG